MEVLPLAESLGRCVPILKAFTIQPIQSKPPWSHPPGSYISLKEGPNGVQWGPYLSTGYAECKQFDKKNSNAVIWRVLLTINRFAMENFKDFLISCKPLLGSTKKLVLENYLFYLTFTDFQTNRRKVPKSDFQSQFSMSTIIWIFLIFLAAI